MAEEKIVAEMAQKIAEALKGSDEWESALKPMKTDISTKTQRLEGLVSKPTDKSSMKSIEVFKTHTFLDDLFLDENNKSLEGIPMVAQMGIVGIAGSGKSILVQEIALRVANEGKRVIFITSEDIWDSPTPRFDLQSRMKQKAEIMGLDWDKIMENLFVLDTITHSELRNWNTLAESYRYLVETKKGIDLLIIDSTTLLENYRGALKLRVMELSRYNQIHGITAIYINQRSSIDIDKYNIAGSIGIAHNLDINMSLDYGKVWGSQMKQDLQKKQGEMCSFARVMDCRLSNFERKHIETTITSNGFIKRI